MCAREGKPFTPLEDKPAVPPAGATAATMPLGMSLAAMTRRTRSAVRWRPVAAETASASSGKVREPSAAAAT